jgi:hypothetical protein
MAFLYKSQSIVSRGSMRDVDMAVLQNAAKTRTIPAFDTIKRLAPSEYEG